jgi:predicted nucleotide-binding protein
MNAPRPSLFIGSSSEGISVAQALQQELDGICEPEVWSQGIFGPTETTICALLGKAHNSDFAALVLTPDDPATIRGTQVMTARAITRAGLVPRRAGDAARLYHPAP